MSKQAAPPREKREKKERDPIKEVTEWANSHLKNYGEEMTDIQHDYCDGVLLCYLVSSVCKTKQVQVPYLNPTDVFQRRRNISAAMTYLENNRYIPSGKIRREDILWGEIMPTYNLLRMINMRIDRGNLPPLPPGRWKRAYSGKPTSRMHGLAADPGGDASFRSRSGMRSLHAGEFDDAIEGSNYIIKIDVDPEFCRYTLVDPDGYEGDERILQNIIVFRGDDVMVGDVPVEEDEDAKETVIRDVVRVLGVDMDDLEDVEDKVEEDDETHKPMYIVGKDKYTPEQIGGLLFQQIKDNASAEADEEVTRASISVPSYFTDEQKRAIKNAARLSGLRVDDFGDDNSAALEAVAMANGHRSDKPKNVIVFEMGRDSCAATSLALEGDEYKIQKNNGDGTLGGAAFDQRLAQGVLSDFKDKAGTRFNKTELIAACEKAKIELSNADRTTVEYCGVAKQLKRAEFDDWADNLFRRAVNVAKQTADGKINQVILMGPPTRMVKLRKLFAEEFGPDVELYDGNRNRPIVLNERPKSEYTLDLNMLGSPYKYELVKSGASPIGKDKCAPIVCFRGNQMTVGEIPEGWADDKRATIIEDIVPVLGRDFNDERLNADVMRYRCHVANQKKQARFIVNYLGHKHVYSAEDIQSMVFEHIKDKILTKNDENVVDTILTIPGYLTEEQKKSLSRAASFAGLNVLSFREDYSEGAAKAREVNKDREDAPKQVIVFHMNAGETTATMYQRNDDGEYEAVKMVGDGNLGGSNFDRKVVSKLEMDKANQSRKMFSVRERNLMLQETEKAKKKLSTEQEATIKVASITRQPYERNLKRSEFERMCDKLFLSTLEPVKQLLEKADVPKSELAQVILTGGPTKMPKLRDLFSQYLGSNCELIDGDKNERIITRYNQPKSELVVGIDLGTSVCRYGVFQDEGADSEVKGTGTKEILSVVCFRDGKATVGEIPEGIEDDPKGVVIRDVKRILGRDFSDPKLQEDIAQFNCKVEKDKKTGRPVFLIPKGDSEKKYTPEQITSMILERVREEVSKDTGENIIDAVITVPALFVNAQRQATKDAGTIAGLNVIRVINDPVAAALSYNLKHQDEEGERNVCVIDMGAGKLDVGLLKLEGGCCTSVATAGNTSLGGIDFDRRIAKKVIDSIKDASGNDPHDTPADIERINRACEEAKIALSTSDSAKVAPSGLTSGEYNETLERAEFEEMCDDLFQACMEPVKQVFDDAPVDKATVKKVILAGGSTKMPKFREMLVDFFGPDVELFDLDANAAVDGAAIQGAMLRNNRPEQLNGLSVRNSTPLSFGISLANGTNNIIIPRGSPIPAKFSTPATTVKDGQRNVGFDVVEGERPIATDCIKLGHVTVEGIQIAKRGVPKLEVTMEINEDGMLVVTGKDLGTGAAMTVRITNSANLSEAEIENMLRESEAKKEEDNRRFSIVEAKTQYQYILDKGDRLLRESRKAAKLPAAEADAIRSNIKSGREWLASHENEEADAYTVRYDELRAMLKKLT